MGAIPFGDANNVNCVDIPLDCVQGRSVAHQKKSKSKGLVKDERKEKRVRSLIGDHG